MTHRKAKSGPHKKTAQKKESVRRGRLAPDRPLAWHQYQELNFSFYEEHPSEFIHMRIEVLSLMLCDEQQLALSMAR